MSDEEIATEEKRSLAMTEVWLGEGESDGEAGALAGVAGDFDFTGMSQDDFMGDGQAQAEAGPETSGLLETVEDVRDLFGRDARSVIFYRD